MFTDKNLKIHAPRRFKIETIDLLANEDYKKFYSKLF